MQIIDAAPLPRSDPSFGTPEDAITYAKRIREELRQPEMDACGGGVMADVRWSDTAIRLHLDNGKTLEWRCGRLGPESRVMDDGREHPMDDAEIEEVVLIRRETLQYVWRRADLLRSLRGQQFLGVHPHRGCCFIYVRPFGILFICVNVDRNTGRPFLIWAKSE